MDGATVAGDTRSTGQATRDAILDALRLGGARRFNELARQVGVRGGALRYHLLILLRADQVRHEGDLYRLNDRPHAQDLLERSWKLRHAAHFLASADRRSRVEVVDEFGGPEDACFRLLTEAGLAVREREGRRVYYRALPAMHRALADTSPDARQGISLGTPLVAQVNAQGQVTLPRDLALAFDIRGGDLVHVEVRTAAAKKPAGEKMDKA